MCAILDGMISDSTTPLVQVAGPLYGPSRVVIETVGGAFQEESRRAFTAALKAGEEAAMPIAYYGPDSPYEFRAVLEPQGGRYVTTALEVRSLPGRGPIQQADLVHIPLSFLSSTLRTVITYKGERFPEHELPKWYAEIKNDPAGNLEHLGTAYRWLRIVQPPATAALAEALDLSPASVRRWLTKAVAAGYLTDEERVR